MEQHSSSNTATKEQLDAFGSMRSPPPQKRSEYKAIMDQFLDKKMIYVSLDCLIHLFVRDLNTESM